MFYAGWNFSKRNAYFLFLCYVLMGFVYVLHLNSEAGADTLHSLQPCEKRLAKEKNKLLFNSDISQLKLACEDLLKTEAQKSILAK